MLAERKMSLEVNVGGMAVPIAAVPSGNELERVISDIVEAKKDGEVRN